MVVCCAARVLRAMSTQAKHTNALLQQRSPYLLQHAHNPVQWYPWGEDAFALAKEQNKLIFLSVGYSTCHWCHVMERESFESEQIAAIMNELYVNVKVDREERPDVDKTYMTFIQALSGGGGGWPMSVFLTPGLEPVTGGTYFPPSDQMGRPGFGSILQHVNKQWTERREDVLRSSAGIMAGLKKAYVTLGPVKAQAPAPLPVVLDNCYQYYHKSWDPRWGGFGDAPKFPQPANLEFLLRLYEHDKEGKNNKRALSMTEKTLVRMAYGGIYDHVLQGFHRYSTDARWHVPHFEKMLYDQGQLAIVYALALQATGNALYRRVLHGILHYVTHQLSHPLGGFYSAEDADSLPTADATQKKEGAFCVWKWDELQQLLDAAVPGSERRLADVFVHYYNCKQTGNTNPMMDPHGELVDQNVLIIYEEAQQTADELDLSLEQVESALEKSRQILAAKRRERPAPHLDTKIMTAWNGLMLSGFAQAARVLRESEPDKAAAYTSRAAEAAAFLQQHNVDGQGRLLRCVYATQRGDAQVLQLDTAVNGFSDDYAFLIQGLLDLHECSADDRWLQWAVVLQKQMDTLFWDDANDATYFLNASDGDSALLRLKDDHDGAEPCVNSVATANLLRLGRLQRQTEAEWAAECQRRAQRTLQAFDQRLRNTPFVVPKLVCALILNSSTS